MTVGAPSCRDDGDPEALSPCSIRKTATQNMFPFYIQRNMSCLHSGKRVVLQVPDVYSAQ